MHALGEDLDAEIAGCHAPQRGGAPQLVVVAAARVQADDEIRAADTRCERVQVGGEIVAAALLAGLDDDDAAGMGNPLIPQGVDRRQAGEGGVAVVGAAPTVEPVALDDGVPRPEALAPALHLRLLVQVSVQDDRAVGRVAARRHVHIKERCAFAEAHHLEGHVRQGMGPAPPLEERDGVVHVAVARPVRVEGGGLVGDLDVLDELRDDGVVPEPVDVALCGCAVHEVFLRGRHERLL